MSEKRSDNTIALIVVSLVAAFAAHGAEKKVDARYMGCRPAASAEREESAVVRQLRKDLMAAKDGDTVVVPPGDHLLRTGLRVDGKRRFTLRGADGSRFVLHFDPTGPVASNANGIAFSNCRNLTVENLRFTTDAWPSSVGRIVAKDPVKRTIDVEILPPFMLSGREHLMGLTTFGENRVPDGAFETFGPQPSGLEYEMLAPSRIRTTLPGGIDFACIRDRHLLALRHELGGNSVFGFGCCHDVTVRDVTIERAMACGTGISPPCSNFVFERLRIGGVPDEPMLFSENSDGIHVVGMSGYITLRDCFFDGMGDDALNVHCKAGEVLDYDPATGALTCICRDTARRVCQLPGGWARVGDELIVYDARTMVSKGRAKVLAYSKDGHAKVAPDAPMMVAGDFLGNARDYPRVTVTGCTFGRNRARGLLLQSHHIRVADCVFRDIASSGVLLAPDVAYWNEAGPVEDVEIRNCLFERCMQFGGHAGNLGAISARTNHQRKEAGKYPPGFHKDIRIAGNTFLDCGRSGVFLTSVLGATVASNRFERCGSAVKKGDPPEYANDVRFFNCAAARAFGNETDNASGCSVSYESSFAAQCRGRRPLVVNGDNDHYYKAGQMRRFLPLKERLTREGPRKYMDVVSSGGKVTHFFACAIGQRADYDSAVCDPIWYAVDEAVARGEKPDEWPVNAKKMYDLGVDPFAEWCKYGRQKGVSVWISQRMNDVHHVHLPWNMRTNRFWYDHPELHRSHGVDKALLAGDWTDEALNYAFPEVREFEFAIFKELVDRYDAEGFELDFMRFWRHLTPGRERSEAPILTEFIRRCREYTRAKAAERGHAILLSSRVPSDYSAALAFGFDPETWAREGLVDMIAVANFWASEDFDFGFDEWKRRISSANPRVALLPCACDNVSSGVSKVCTTTLGALKGWADNAYSLGADGLYVFNAAYMPDDVQRELYGPGLEPQAVSDSERRHVVTYHDCVPRGMDAGRQLPVSLGKGGRVSARMGTLPDGRRTVSVVVAGNAALAMKIDCVALNGASAEEMLPVTRSLSRYGGAEVAWSFVFPASAAKIGVNDIAFKPGAGTGDATWVEIDVLSRDALQNQDR